MADLPLALLDVRAFDLPQNLDFHLNPAGEAALGIDGSGARMVELQPGEASMHSVELLHGGGPNTSPRARIAFVMRFISSHTRCRTPVRDSAMLVRGKVVGEHWDLERRPTEDFSAEAFAALARAVDGTPSGFGDRLQTPAKADAVPAVTPSPLPVHAHDEM